MIRPLLALAALALASGCSATLDVNVDVMNPVYVKATLGEAGLIADANELAAGGHQRADRFVAIAMANYRGFRENCFDTMIAAANREGAKTTLTTADRDDWKGYAQQLIALKSNAGQRGDVDKLEREMRQILHAADGTARNTLGGDLGIAAGTGQWAKPLSDRVKAQLAVRNAAYDEQADRVSRAIQGQAILCIPSVVNVAKQSPQVEAATVEVGKAEDRAQQNIQEAKAPSIVGGGVLLKDMPEAYFVTSALDKMWGRTYNRAFGQGEFGNTSIAIKMNDTADFSIKGFVFDGRSTAEIVKKVATQTIVTVAAAYGAPFAAKAPVQGQPSTPIAFDPTKQISGARTTVAQAKAQELAYRTALFQIADSVIGNYDGLKSQNATAKAIVQSTVDAYKSSYATPPTP